MNLTGHPFIDVGMGIAAKLAGLESLDDLTPGDLAAAVSHFEDHLESIQRLKVLAIYWTNNPFMGKNLGTLPDYQKKLKALQDLDQKGRGSCQVCGADSTFASADRCWFPLGGSYLGDSVTYPGLRAKMLCANCFRALIALPLGGTFCKGGVFGYHLLDPKLQVQAVHDGVSAVRSAMAQGSSGNAALKASTRLSGRMELLELAAKSRLWGTNNKGKLSRASRHGATIFSFSNSGTGAAYNEMRLPAQALEFFGEISTSADDLTDLFLTWAEDWGKHVKKTGGGAVDRLCDEVEKRTSIAPTLAAMVKGRKIQAISPKEKELLKLYEDVALEKRTRFDAVERIAQEVLTMERRYQDSFRKQLANIRSKEAFLKLLKEFAHSDNTRMRLSREQIRVVDDSRAAELISLLYLLIVAEEQPATNPEPSQVPSHD